MIVQIKCTHLAKGLRSWDENDLKWFVAYYEQGITQEKDKLMQNAKSKEQSMHTRVNFHLPNA